MPFRYNFILAIQGVIDICHHIVARLAGRVSDEYGECFLILNQMGYIDHEYALALKSMAGFRKVLIHLYYQVDDRKVYKHLKEDLPVFDSNKHILAKISS